MDDEDLIPLRVADVRVAVPAGNGVEAGLVVLEEEAAPYRRIQMFVGQHEARAIHVAWSNTVAPRPSTWDLFVTTLSLLDTTLRRVVITDVEEERHFFARVDLERLDGGDPVVLTARPSDALALALRAYRAQIAVRPEVLAEVGVLADGTRPEPAPMPAPADPADGDDPGGPGDAGDPVDAPIRRPDTAGPAGVPQAPPPADPALTEPPPAVPVLTEPPPAAAPVEGDGGDPYERGYEYDRADGAGDLDDAGDPDDPGVAPLLAVDWAGPPPRAGGAKKGKGKGKKKGQGKGKKKDR